MAKNYVVQLCDSWPMILELFVLNNCWQVDTVYYCLCGVICFGRLTCGSTWREWAHQRTLANPSSLTGWRL